MSQIIVFPPDGAAGIEMAIAPPAGKLWKVKSIAATLSSSVAVPLRKVRLILLDTVSGAVVWRTENEVTQAGGLGVIYNFWNAPNPSTPTPVGALVRQIAIPHDIYLYATAVFNFQLQSLTDNFDVADQWAGKAIVVEESSL